MRRWPFNILLISGFLLLITTAVVYQTKKSQTTLYWATLEVNDPPRLILWQPESDYFHHISTVESSFIPLNLKWSPDGQWLLFNNGTSEFPLQRLRLSGADTIETIDAHISLVRGRSSGTAPNGLFILAWHEVEEAFYRLNSDGTHLHRLPVDQSVFEEQGAFLSSFIPLYSSDSQWVYFVASVSDIQSRLYKMRTDGSALIPLMDIEALRYPQLIFLAPNDQWVAYQNLSGAVVLADVVNNSTQILPAFRNLDANDSLVWLEDNSLLVYGDFEGTDSIHFYRVTDQRRDLIDTVPNWSHFSLSVNNRYLALWKEAGINTLQLEVIDLVQDQHWTSNTRTDRACFSSLWAFDSNWLLFSERSADGSCNQYRIQPDGSHRQAIKLPPGLVSLTTTSSPWFLGRNLSGEWVLMDIIHNVSLIVPGDIRAWSTGPTLGEPFYSLWAGVGLFLCFLGIFSSHWIRMLEHVNQRKTEEAEPKMDRLNEPRPVVRH